ncbi:DUF6515 family protein [Gallaecimonas sp. GXIMD4217]|uniref:DUF6515 family protein n=1 Tax=Gallaecimonas sp. GXIMD4217 TaxID=3131927 RepID=UPI00311ADFEF
MRYPVLTSLLMASLIAPPVLAAGPGHGHGAVAVKASHHRGHHKFRHHRKHHYGHHRYGHHRHYRHYRHHGHHYRHSYHRSLLPDLVTFVVLAGVTYAVIDGLYYRKRGDEYRYVERPPAGSYNRVPSSGLPVGTLVSSVPAGAQSVVIDGTSYLVSGGTWYVPVQGRGYVVVSPRL